MELFEGQIITAPFLNGKTEIIKNKVKETIFQIGAKSQEKKLNRWISKFKNIKDFSTLAI